MGGEKGGVVRRRGAVPVEPKIVEIGEERVILDRDLAEIYGVDTRVLNQAVKRNAERFPGDFAFQLTLEEAQEIPRSKSQSVILKREKDRRCTPEACRKVAPGKPEGRYPGSRDHTHQSMHPGGVRESRFAK
jgi:hypothetical protein